MDNRKCALGICNRDAEFAVRCTIGGITKTRRFCATCAELVHGVEYVIPIYWSESLGQFVTVPA